MPRAASMRRVVVAPTTPTFSLPPNFCRKSLAQRGAWACGCTRISPRRRRYVDFCRERFNKLPVEFVADHEWLGPDVWFAHLVHLRDAAKLRCLRETRQRLFALSRQQRASRQRHRARTADGGSGRADVACRGRRGIERIRQHDQRSALRVARASRGARRVGDHHRRDDSLGQRGRCGRARARCGRHDRDGQGSGSRAVRHGRSALLTAFTISR